MTDAFVAPDWAAPLDVAALLDAVPPEGKTRGLHLQHIVDSLRAAKLAVEATDFGALQNYPMRDYMALLHRASRQLHPKVSVREALRRMGEGIYLSFTQTMIGKAIFALANHNFRAVAKLAPTAYAASYSIGVVEVEAIGKGHVEVQLREMWPFVDSFQVGAWESAMRTCKVTGQILVRVLSACAADFDIRWSE